MPEGASGCGVVKLEPSSEAADVLQLQDVLLEVEGAPIAADETVTFRWGGGWRGGGRWGGGDSVLGRWEAEGAPIAAAETITFSWGGEGGREVVGAYAGWRMWRRRQLPLHQINCSNVGAVTCQYFAMDRLGPYFMYAGTKS